MLSICIPIFNHDVRSLVKDLHQQATDSGKEFEILLMDDASEETCKKLNHECATLEKVSLAELEENVGRSRIRNRLAEKARYPWLIFMDCDSQCRDRQYIQNYLKHIQSEGIVCGGRLYLPTPPEDSTYLHWLFGTHREVNPPHIRALKPNHSFMTNNFMIAASIMKKIKFNESLKGYGHEDTLFGVELLKNHIKIQHIDNPLYHVGLQSADEFLHKTREGTRNLLKVYKILNHDPALIEMVKLLKVWKRLYKTGLRYPTGMALKIIEPLMLGNLRGKKPKLLWLDLFKLGSICRQTADFRKT